MTSAVRWVYSGRPEVTDGGNHILDGGCGPIPDAARLEADIHAVPGVVETGLFQGMADTVLVAGPTRPGPGRGGAP